MHDGATTGKDEGWAFNAVTGQFVANNDDPTVIDANVTYDRMFPVREQGVQ